MAIGFLTATANARLVATLTAAVSGQSVDGGSGVGVLVIGTSALSGETGVLVTIPLLTPSFSIAGKVATLLGVPLSAEATAAGTAALAELRDSAGNAIETGLTVGTSGASIILNSVAFGVGETISITSGTLTHA